jgi:alpha-1,6-mannosyltransferase
LPQNQLVQQQNSHENAHPRRFAESNFAGWALLLAAVVSAHVFLAPFTKVEESFNVQAIHDMLYHGLDVSQYDHLEFPGVVPRTFIGALAVATTTLPFRAIASLFRLPKLSMLFASRLVLGCLSVVSFSALKRASDRKFGPCIGGAMVLLTATQFHLPFYMSRPLPNTLACVVTNVACALWVEGKHPGRTIALLTFAATVLRCDVLLLAGLIGLHMLVEKRVTLYKGLQVGAAAFCVSLALSVCIDSFFWRRWLWPEGEVLFFNTALNK